LADQWEEEEGLTESAQEPFEEGKQRALAALKACARVKQVK